MIPMMIIFSDISIRSLGCELFFRPGLHVRLKSGVKREVTGPILEVGEMSATGRDFSHSYVDLTWLYHCLYIYILVDASLIAKDLYRLCG